MHMLVFNWVLHWQQVTEICHQNFYPYHNYNSLSPHHHSKKKNFFLIRNKWKKIFTPFEFKKAVKITGCKFLALDGGDNAVGRHRIPLLEFWIACWRHPWGSQYGSTVTDLPSDVKLMKRAPKCPNELCIWWDFWRMLPVSKCVT